MELPTLDTCCTNCEVVARLCASCQLEGMLAENELRKHRGESPAYKTEDLY